MLWYKACKGSSDVDATYCVRGVGRWDATKLKPASPQACTRGWLVLGLHWLGMSRTAYPKILKLRFR